MRISIARTKTRRALLMTLGVFSAALGLVGVFVPGLPTTVFVIAASYLFARSSPMLDGWLRRNRWLGPSLQQFAETGGMTPRSKAFALTSMWIGLGLSWYALAPVGTGIRLLVIGLGLIGTGTLLFFVRVNHHPLAPAGGLTFSEAERAALQRAALTATRRQTPSRVGLYVPTNRLLIEPGFLICITSPLASRDTNY